MQDTPVTSESLKAFTLPADLPHIPGYRIVRKLGQGGMATVYLAVQESLDRQVSIKVMVREALLDEISKQRFEHEARTIAKLEHPSIVAIHEVGRTAEGLLYYVMPYLANGDLAQRDFSQNEDRIVDVLHALLSGLEYAHQRGIVHRDVKAENVLFDNADRPLLTDFGIALSKRDSTRITTVGLAVGSGGYMAPEQARGEEVDGRADLYAVGVLAFELLSGRLPYQSPEPLALALMHAQDPIPRLPQEKRHWQPFIDKAMAKSPDHRFRNAQQMLRALERVGDRVGPGFGGGLRRRLDDVRDWHLWRNAPAMFALGLGLAVGVAWLLHGALPSVGTPAAVLPDFDFFTAAPETPTAETPAAPPAEPSEAERLLAAAQEQLERSNLTAPADANALESTLAAWQADPQNPAVAAGLDAVLDALSAQLSKALDAGNDERATFYHGKAREFATTTGASSGERWRAFKQAARDALAARLTRQLDALDRIGAERSAALVAPLELAHPDLDPLLARVTELPQPGARFADNGGPSLRFVAPGPGNAPPLAVSEHEISRADYADFVRATRRASARCNNRLSPLQLFQRRNWSDPGYPQSPEHPAVCVSWDDANAYAQWLSQRTGQHYRLPSAREWQRLADFPDRRGTSTGRGTVAPGRGAASPLGVQDLHGNASEWLSDCSGTCARRLTAGLSWRDSGTNWARLDGQPADRGYDDVGFRLVRELRPGDPALAAR